MDGDSLSYLDMMERSIQEERRRERERQIMDEGKQLWQLKKQEQLETEIKDQEEVGHNFFSLNVLKSMILDGGLGVCCIHIRINCIP